MENLNAIQVRKVSNPDVKPTTQDSRNLPKMPRLYLELIENKDKVKQNMVNKEYDPDDDVSEISFFGGGGDNRAMNIMSDIEEESEAESTDVSSVASSSSSIKQYNTNNTNNTNTPHDSPKFYNEKQNKPAFSSGGETEEESDNDDDEDDEDDEHSGYSDSDGGFQQQQPPQHSSKSQKYAKILDESMPPKLSDLEKKGEIHNRQSVPNLDRIYATEDEEDEMKRELLFKFELLKKAYKTEVPEFNVHSDLKQMTRSYENTLRRVSLDSCVENYKQLLIGGFMVLEFLLGYLFKFDMQGFTQQQILNMNQYERLLIELGEQSYVPGGSQWPVEIRLLILVFSNALIFIIAKMIMKKTGSNIMQAMNTFSRPPQAVDSMNKRKMRGPSIQVDDIPDITADDAF